VTHTDDVSQSRRLRPELFPAAYAQGWTAYYAHRRALRTNAPEDAARLLQAAVKLMQQALAEAVAEPNAALSYVLCCLCEFATQAGQYAIVYETRLQAESMQDWIHEDEDYWIYFWHFRAVVLDALRQADPGWAVDWYQDLVSNNSADPGFKATKADAQLTVLLNDKRLTPELLRAQGGKIYTLVVPEEPTVEGLVAVLQGKLE